MHILRKALLPLFSLWSLAAFSQNQNPSPGNCQLYGYLEGGGGGEITIEIDRRPQSGEVERIQQKLQSGVFNLPLSLPYGQLVDLHYMKRHTTLYLEPGDSLYLEGEAAFFPNNLRYGAQATANNQLLRAYRMRFPENSYEFQQRQYRSGWYWYRLPPKIDGMMQRLSQESFIASMESQKRLRERFIAEWEEKQPGNISDGLREYLRAEIEYRHAYYLLCYGDIFQYKHPVTQELFQKATQVPLTGAPFGSRYYQEYIKAFMNHKHMTLSGNNVEGILRKIYDLAPNYLGGEHLAYFRSELICNALKRKRIDEIQTAYTDFTTHNAHPQYQEKVEKAYRKAVKHHSGSIAPSFGVQTSDGVVMSLSQYRGRPIFLNFWASWCHSCVKKMDRMKALQRELEAKGVVFIHLSLDQSRDGWLNSIALRNYGGIHGYLPGGIDHKIAKDYDVSTLPSYFLIDRQGRFLPKPQSDYDSLARALRQLAR